MARNETPHRAPTLNDVARLAGVSRATASRALLDADHVAEAKRTAVREAAEKLGYVPNQAARSLVTRRSGTIAVVLAESDQRVFADPFFGGIISGINAVVAEADQQLVLLMGDPVGHQARVLRYLRSKVADGIIIVSHHRMDGVIDTAASSGTPTVLVGRPWGPSTRIPYVDCDNAAGARLAVRHLVEMGHRRIDTISGSLDMPAGKDRLDGWRDELIASGLMPGRIVQGDFSVESGERAADALLRTGPLPHAIFVASDLMAAGALNRFAAEGIEVPRDLSIVGFDDGPVARTTTPPLTSIRNSVDELARASAQLIIDYLDSGTVPSSMVLAPELVERASVRKVVAG